MLFKVTHIDQQGHRHKARVPAVNVSDCLDQVDREWGPARVVSCIRMSTRPVLHLVPPKAHNGKGRALCG